MPRPTDETLMAYADGCLVGEGRTAVERYLMGDAAARRLVRLMTMANVLTQEAFDNRDFSVGTQRLAAVIRRAPTTGKTATGFFGSRWYHCWFTGGFSMAAPIAAGGLAGVCAVVATLALVRPAPIEQMHGAMHLALGTVDVGTPLWRALDEAVGGKPSATAASTDVMRPASGPAASTGFQLVAQFKDKFGNPCVELDMFADARSQVPDALLVACRTNDRAWTLLGAIATHGTERTPRDLYATNSDQVHDAMAGFLNLLGARQRTSAIQPESETR